MNGKIFINYRRDDAPAEARGVRDVLAARFGQANIFMDVDNLLPGQLFEQELSKALNACDVLVAIIGNSWLEQMSARLRTNERDYVREEIAAALRRRIFVIPVRVGRDGRMPTLLRSGDLPDDLKELAFIQKHDVSHESFGRDAATLADAIRAIKRGPASRLPRSRSMSLFYITGGVILGSAVTMAIAYWMGASVPFNRIISDRQADVVVEKRAMAKVNSVVQERSRGAQAIDKSEIAEKSADRLPIVGKEQSFDYSTRDGVVTIGSGDLVFDISFNKASDTNIYVSRTRTATKIARIKKLGKGSIIVDSDYDMSSRTYTIGVAEAFIAQNRNGDTFAGRILEIKDDSRGDEHDLVRFVYNIFPAGQAVVLP